MTLTRFARMCETLEEQSPTVKTHTVNSSLSVFSNKPLVVQILALEMPQNNIAEKKAIKWIAEAFNVLVPDIVQTKQTWDDLGQGMYYNSYIDADCGISLQEFHRLLTLDCSTIQGDSFRIISEALRNMSGLELKWFIRYWLRVPRNGMGGGSNGVLKKALVYHYFNEKILEWAKFNSLNSIVTSLENKQEPENELTVGKAVKPMLAKKYTGKLFDKTYFDIKYDGNRYLIHKKDEDVIIFNRASKVIENARFQDIVDIIMEFEGDDFILDTEIYPVNEEGQPLAHQVLAKRVHSKDLTKAIRECPVRLVVFDILRNHGKTIVHLPYSLRLAGLKRWVPEQYQATQLDGLEVGYNIAIGRGFEGIMVKNLDAPYEMGKRSKHLLKHKPPRHEFDLVITSAKYGEGKRSSWFGTFGISARDANGGYVSVGSVGTGFSEKELALLTTQLKKIVDTYDNPVYHFLPRIVLQVTSDAVTSSRDGSIGLRFPRLMRIRDDKHASECDTIEAIREMMQ